MRLALVSYFDIGESYGLGDDVFRPESVGPGYDLGLVGINNPLGSGVVVKLSEDTDLLAEWRSLAASQLDREETATGFHEDLGLSEATFRDELRRLVLTHPLSRCDITVFAAGIALLYIGTAPDVPVDFLRGLGRCLEYAAYTPPMARRFLDAARSTVLNALSENRDRNGLVLLTQRREPRDERDSKGYVESTLLTGTGFTNVVLAVDEGDHLSIDRAMSRMNVEPSAPRVDYEFHGTLTFDWATCVLEAHDLGRGANTGVDDEEPADQRVRRMVADIEIAHTFAAVATRSLSCSPARCRRRSAVTR